LEQSELKRILKYNPNTGEFIWIARANKKAAAIKLNTVAGFVFSNGYRYIRINKKSRLAHRLAFLYMNGSIPEQIDHINHNRDDNRWANIRPANVSINNRNLSIQKRNKSGYTGVIWFSPKEQWAARIGVEGKSIHLGYYDNIDFAIGARLQAEKDYGFHKNHGRKVRNETNSR